MSQRPGQRRPHARRGRLAPIGALLLAVLAGILAPAPALAGAAENARFLAAMRQEDLGRIGALLRAGADPRLALGNGKTALMIAAKYGRAGLVRALLDAGADVGARSRNGGTALMFAALSGDRATVSLLLDHGADVNAAGGFGWTALMVAAVKGHGDLVRLLMEHGAAPDTPDFYGWTPLMRAVDTDHPASARVLIDSGRVDLAARDETGATVLHHAAARGETAIVKLLLAKGAPARAVDRRGRTAADVARAEHHPRIAKLLEAAGG